MIKYTVAGFLILLRVLPAAAVDNLEGLPDIFSIAQHSPSESYSEKQREENLGRILREPRPPQFRTLAKERDLLDPIKLDYGNKHPFERRRDLQGGDGIVILGDADDESDTFSPLRFRFVTEPLESLRGSSAAIDAKLDVLINEILPAVETAWTNHLQVVPVEEPIPISTQACFGIYNDVIPQSLLDSGAESADLVVFASAKDTLVTSFGQSINVCGPGTLAVATSCARDQFDRPVIGFINFCIDNVTGRRTSEATDPMSLVLDQGQFEGAKLTGTPEVGQGNLRKSIIFDEGQVADTKLIGIHEVGHVLGVDLELYKLFRDPTTGEPLTPRNPDGSVIPRSVTCVDGTQQFIEFPAENTLQVGTTPSGLIFHDMVTPRVRQVTRNHFNCQSLAGARLENQPTNEGVCTGTHWDERVFFTELLGPIFSGAGDGQADVLSPLTLALMEDSGWYRVSYGEAQLSPFGHGAGCDFVNEDCIINDEVPEFGQGVFCDTPLEFDFFTGQVSQNNPLLCDPSHTIFALCNLLDENDGAGIDVSDVPIRYFTNQGLASTSAQLDFCPLPIIPVGLDCTDENTPAGFAAYAGEQYGPNSRCINAQIRGATSTVVRPACLPIVCDEDNFQVVVGGQACQFDGQMIDIPPNGVFECPKLASICPQLFCPGGCSGRGICNYDATPPQCECFDTTDTTSECGGDLAEAPPGTPPSTTPSPPGGSPTDGSSGSFNPFASSSPLITFATTIMTILMVQWM